MYTVGLNYIPKKKKKKEKELHSLNWDSSYKGIVLLKQTQFHRTFNSPQAGKSIAE